MSQPRVLDLYCKAGGAAHGYQQAGFEVVGVDVEPQPNYAGDEFHQMGALATLESFLIAEEWPMGGEFALIHASPPCQLFSVSHVIHRRRHLDLIGATRELLRQTGMPWVIENVPGAPLRKDLELCGSMFGLETSNGRLRRHRVFELSYPAPILVPPHQHHGKTISVFGHGGHDYHGVGDWREVMGMPWATRDEIAEAIPPAYCKFIGEAFLAQMSAAGQWEKP